MNLGEVRASSGVSGNFAVGTLANDERAARGLAQPTGALSGTPSVTFTRGALVSAAVAPGFSPYAAARVGIGERFEGGIAYTGRAGHLDLRRSFDWGNTSLSIGIGLTVPIYEDSYTSSQSAVNLQELHGYGGDIPVLIGWQSAAKVYMMWAGLRGGFDHVDVSALSTEPSSLQQSDSLSGDRFYGGGVVGFAAGFRHVHAALELDAAYQSISGTYVQGSVPTNATVQGFSLAPAGAIWFTF